MPRGRPKKIDSNLGELITQMVSDGISFKKICAELSLSDDTLRAYCREIGLEKPAKRCWDKVIPEQIEIARKEIQFYLIKAREMFKFHGIKKQFIRENIQIILEDKADECFRLYDWSKGKFKSYLTAAFNNALKDILDASINDLDTIELDAYERSLNKAMTKDERDYEAFPEYDKILENLSEVKIDDDHKPSLSLDDKYGQKVSRAKRANKRIVVCQKCQTAMNVSTETRCSFCNNPLEAETIF